MSSGIQKYGTLHYINVVQFVFTVRIQLASKSFFILLSEIVTQKNYLRFFFQIPKTVVGIDGSSSFSETVRVRRVLPKLA